MESNPDLTLPELISVVLQQFVITSTLSLVFTATMVSKNYPITPAKVGNQDGFRLPRAFFKDYPHLVNAPGHIEVLDENTLLVRLEVDQTEEDEETESLMLSLFLDTLSKDMIENPASLVPYIQEMSEEVDELLKDFIRE
jgi:antitoxin PrlF